jgi:molybdopterin-guanine dinucleotide biosynthesis protein A
MPYLEAPLLTRLSRHAVGAQAVAAVVDQRWQPFFARYRADRTRATIEAEAPTSSGSLQSVLTGLGAESLPLTPDEVQQLRDWDAPDDMV